MRKANVSILGTGNIGSDLLRKIMRSPSLQCTLFSGRNKDSTGIGIAKKLGIATSFDSIDALVAHQDSFDIIFDATSAETHRLNTPILQKLGKFVIDLTPSPAPTLCIPALNLDECLSSRQNEINLISCGAQANVPLVLGLKQAGVKLKYVEFASSISSKSAGPATRENIDEYVRKTRQAIKQFSGVADAKVILNLNPAEPPINMHNTIYADIEGSADPDVVTPHIKKMVESIRAYVPGYGLKIEPIYDGSRIIIINEAIGAGDYLPSYAGNLDIMTCAGVAVAEGYQKKWLQEG